MAGDDVKIKIKVDGDTKNYDKAIDKSQKKTSKLSDAAESVGLKLNPALIGATAAAAGFAAAIGSIKAAAALEDIAVQFEVLTGSAIESKRVVSELQDFAAGTPFQFEGIAESTKQLLGFGFTADEAIDKMKPLGDVAAAIGVPLTDLSLVFGQVRAAGKLTGERLLQLQERAVPIGAALAETLGVAETAVKDLVSAGKVDFNTFEQAFKSISAEGGIAFGGMEKKSQTLTGRISTLKDNIVILASLIGERLIPYVKSATTGLTNFIQAITKAAKGPDVNELKTRIDSITKSIGELDDKAKGEGYFGTTRARARALRSELKELVKEYEPLRAAADAAAAENEKRKAEQDAKDAAAAAVKVENKKALDDKILELEKAKTEDMSALREEEIQKELDDLILKQEALNEQKIINDAKELSQRGQQAEALKLIDKLQYDNKKKFEEATTKSRIDLASATGNLLTAIGGQASKAGFIIAKGAAIAQSIVATNVASAKALAIDPTGVLSARVQLAGRINTAAIAATAIQGLAEGGIVGGRQGTDVNPAMLTRGELVAPTQNFEEVIGSVRAQRNAEELAEEGGAGAGGVSEVLIGFTDDAFEIIEQKLLERRAIGAGSL